MIPESEWTKGQREFVGTTFPTDKGSVLTVTGLSHKQGSHAMFSLECSVCSKNTGLWPDGSITGVKSHLVNGAIPCGCAKNPQWKQSQYETLIHRKCLERGYNFQGFVGEWNGNKTYLRLYNLNNGNTWQSTTINSFLNGRGCPLEGITSRIEQQHILQTEREDQISDVFAVEGGSFIGWSDEYNGAFSKFNWICSEGHPCETSVNNFLNNGSRCMTCKKMKQREEGHIYGYYPARKYEQDNLYIIRFKKGNYIKVGRSFNVEQRLKGNTGLLKASKHKRDEIEILAMYTGTHKNVYETEQLLHEELAERGFYHETSTWTVETFDADCEDVLFRLLGESGLEEGEW